MGISINLYRVNNAERSLFDGYVKPLIDLYFTALENKNSILFIGQ